MPLLDKRILVVEDNRELRELVVELLEGAGYQVSSAENGAQALTEAKARHPHLILLDLMMPVMNGYQFREKQLAEPDIREIPVVVLSAHENNLEVAEYLPKPFQVQEVLDAVHRHAV